MELLSYKGDVMETLLIVLIILIIYAFIGYPAFLAILSIIFKHTVIKKDRTDFTVTLIIAAYNEENIIRDKLLNSLQLDYPSHNIEIIVSSDGSTDKTDEIVKSFKEQGIKLNRVEGRKGKTEAQNQTVRLAKGDIIVFSDANAFYKSDSIKNIVQNFNDERVGGVCGKLIYSNGNNPDKDAESTYWNFESYIKQKESLLSSVIGANGSIYAIRRSLYSPLDNTLISDFVEPLKVIEKGYRFVYEKEAISSEETESVSGPHAYNRKVRINVRTILGIYNTYNLLNVFKYGWVSFQYFSHKILRYIMPLLLFSLFILNLFLLDYFIWKIMFFIQITFYSLAYIGYLRRTNSKQTIIFSLPYYFILVHMAIFTAFYQLGKGERKTTWETERN